MATVLITHCERAPEVKLVVHGALDSGWLSDLTRIEVGKKIVVECTGYWDQNTEITAYYSGDGSTDTALWGGSGDSLTSEEFEWTPEIADSSNYRSQLRCEARRKTDGGFFETGELLSSDSTDVDIVLAPQPAEEVFVAVRELGHPASATLTVLARPEVDGEQVVWELAGNFLGKVTESSLIQGYSLEIHQRGLGETDIELNIRSVKESDLGSHTVTVANELGSQTYRVRFFVAESAKVFIGRVKSEFLAGSRDNVECRSEGGNPPPELKAWIHMNGIQTRNLELLKEDDGIQPGMQRKTFLLDPRVEERTDSQTFVVCEAIQRAGQQVVFTNVNAKSVLRIVYPPQAQEEHYVYSNLGESAMLSLQVDAFPLPSKSDVVWAATENNPNNQMTVSLTSSSITTIDLTVLRVEERDMNVRQTLTVRNEHGVQAFYFRIVKPTPVWVWILVALGIIAAIVLPCVIYCIYTKMCRSKKRSRHDEPSNAETQRPFLTTST